MNVNIRVYIKLLNFFILNKSNIYKNREHYKELHVPNYIALAIISLPIFFCQNSSKFPSLF